MTWLALRQGRRRKFDAKRIRSGVPCRPKNGNRIAKKLIPLDSKLADCERSTAGRLLLHDMHLQRFTKLGCSVLVSKNKKGELALGDFDHSSATCHQHRMPARSSSSSPKAPK
jgi:hypothetical protein